MDIEVTRCIDYHTLTVSSAAAGVGLSDATPAISAKATQALITVETDQVRFRADGTAPTSTEGHLLEAGDALQFTGKNWAGALASLLFIKVTTDAALKITTFGM